ncbi:PrsW family intramembrane metalloprotease [Nocardioides perillae]|uniref:RsiW-degrading membrane proteinase PrsW (M82 family) n=1 Tax=Nocardioides perillae TaxID=1119534 RepID=A0A7Y9RXT3_9ACTN|nr:PrsW family intramembrane metalloprotease [Nocardioides perillae]NYG56543.1 RsiW-degrading membrane proteinase PrsW (M82 family) [Nocardioides perillae]
MARRPRDSVAFTVVVTVLVALCAVPLALVVALSGAPGTVLLATVLAALPVGPVVACFVWLDRYEPEPRRLLAAGLVWGGVVATAFALVLGGIGGLLVPVTEAASLAVVAPVTEELTKGLFLLLLLWWRRHELDGVLDGIVYAGMVGVGFAFVENVLYLAAAYDGTDGVGPGGVEAVTGTFLVRCLFSPFAHPLFTAFTGIGVGIAVGARSGLVRVTAPLTGYALAVTAHALWNGSTLFGFGGFLGTYLLLMVPAFFFVAGLSVWARRAEGRVLRIALEDAAARGLLPAVDVPWLVDLQARRASRRHARAVGGPAMLAAVRDYQQAAVELGFLHHRYLRGTPPPDFAERGQHFVARIHAVRPHVALPGQVVPAR